MRAFPGRTQGRPRADVGAKGIAPVVVYTRARWQPRWVRGDVFFDPEFRLFWESDKGFGYLNSLATFRWFGEGNPWTHRAIVAARIEEEDPEWNWEFTLRGRRVYRLRDETKRGGRYGKNDNLQSLGGRVSLFGEDNLSMQTRATVIYRSSLYNDWVIFDVSPGVQWRREYDWETEFRFDVGVELHF